MQQLATTPKTLAAPLKVLLIEDRVLDTQIDFGKREGSEVCLCAVQRLEQGRKVLERERVDVILLDLFLENIQGLATLSAMRSIAPDIPIVVLTSLNDEALALQALKRGAQDYLIKGSLDSRQLLRAIRYAMERKHVETHQASLEQRAVQMQKLEALGTLAGGVAHNFNNLLMAILANSQLLSKEIPDENARKHLQAIKRAAQRASTLTRQLLLFSHKEVGRLTPLSLNKIVLDMEELLRSVLGSDIVLGLDLAAEVVRIKGDPTQLQHLIMSLVLNSREAMASTGRVDIRTAWIQTASGPEAILTIEDDGCGMSSETREHIFEPFFTTRSRAIAAGLGLSTVYGIVKQHSARIEVDTGTAKGATFSIVFPGCVPAVPVKS